MKITVTIEEDSKYLRMQDILKMIESLAEKENFYERLLEDIISLREEVPNVYEDLKADLEKERFENIVDVILYFEHGQRKERE